MSRLRVDQLTVHNFTLIYSTGHRTLHQLSVPFCLILSIPVGYEQCLTPPLVTTRALQQLAPPSETRQQLSRPGVDCKGEFIWEQI